MKSLADRRRLYIFLRILAGSTAAIIVWGIINLRGLISLCAADDPGCHLHDIVPVQLEHGWLGGGTSDVKAFESGFAIPDNDDDDDDDDDGGEIVVRKAASQNTFSGSVSSVVSQARDHGETTFLAHAPGFSVIQNAYWRNDTWYFVTSKPWSQPEVSLVVTNGPDHGQTTKTDDSVVQVLSLAEANAKGLALEKVHVVPGTSVSLVHAESML
ncbi:hypothetical protein QFC19_001774 [Naganishia cerealis]|uniref:Uncharacterized protein n=1 Tax=Naganishia cerealis TaxID=610337 RepID=A0ACC2WFB8_9TREE|nr:hypothetical protein QFC19_001774 [Naganishia cerealis]